MKNITEDVLCDMLRCISKFVDIGSHSCEHSEKECIDGFLECIKKLNSTIEHKCNHILLTMDSDKTIVVDPNDISLAHNEFTYTTVTMKDNDVFIVKESPNEIHKMIKILKQREMMHSNDCKRLLRKIDCCE